MEDEMSYEEWLKWREEYKEKNPDIFNENQVPRGKQMKINTLCYNVILPIKGVIDISNDATDEEIEKAIYDDACLHKGTCKSMEVKDINDITPELLLENPPQADPNKLTK